MDDNSDIAFLAASCEKEMKTSLAGSGIEHNRTDFRRFLGQPGQPINQYPQHPQNQYPQQLAYAPHPPQPQQHPQHPQQYQSNAPVDYVLPEGNISPTNVQFLPMPPGYQPPPTAPSPNTLVDHATGFRMPDYNAPSKKYLEDETQFRDALIEEVKSLKTNIKSQKLVINKLSKQVEEVKVMLQKITDSILGIPAIVPQPPEQNLDVTPDKS
jgi:hypothetical protein